MFAYPSGHAHVGHVRNYIIGDIVARLKRMQGFNVLHPFGWDAFGLPAENAAIKNNLHPETWTLDNIAYMKGQLQRLGISYAWGREIATCLPEYYHWNQWLFIRMFEKGLAYRRRSSVNWCPSCNTVLANEQVVDGGCWRCHSVVEQRDLEQWFFRITAVRRRAALRRRRADGLAREGPDDAAELDRALGRRPRQVPAGGAGRPAIRADRGLHDAHRHDLRRDLRPARARAPLVARFIAESGDAAGLRDARDRFKRQDRVARMSGEVEKEGFDTGRLAINPFTGEPVPVWVANFVLGEYGTGAVMAVPAHDERDFEFARKYGLPVAPVVQPAGERLVGETMTAAYVEDGTLADSGEFSGLSSTEGWERMARTPRRRASARRPCSTG